MKIFDLQLKLFICTTIFLIIASLNFPNSIVLSAEIVKQSPTKIILGSLFYLIIEFEGDFIDILSLSSDVRIKNYTLYRGKTTNKIKVTMQILDEAVISLDDLKLSTTTGSYTFEDHFIEIAPLQISSFKPVTSYTILQIFKLKVLVLALVLVACFFLVIYIKKPLEHLFTIIKTNIISLKLYAEIMNNIKKIDFISQPKEKAYLFSDIIKSVSKNSKIWDEESPMPFHSYQETIHNLKYRSMQDFSEIYIANALNLFMSLKSEIIKKLSCIPERYTLFIKLFYK